MATLQELRKQYPQYNDMSDGDLAKSFHGKYYSDMDFGEFASKIGFDALAGNRSSDRTGAAIAGAADTASLGLSDEIGAGLQAPFRYAGSQIAGTDKSLGQAYSEALANNREGKKDIQERNPIYYGGGQVLGAVGTGLVGAGTKAGAKALSVAGRGLLPNAASTGGKLANLGTKALASGAIGAAQGQLYGMGSGEGEADRMERGAEGRTIGGVVGGAAPILTAGAGKIINNAKPVANDIVAGLRARSPEVLQDIAEAKRSAAGGLYTQMRATGATLNSEASQKLVKQLDDAISSKQFIPQLNPKTQAVVEHIRTAAQSGDVALGDLDQYRRLLGKIGASEDGVSAGAVRGAIDDAVNSLKATDLSSGTTEAVDLLNQGRRGYAEAAKFEDITDILTKASGDPNKIKSGLTRYLQNDKNTRGWSASQLSALKEAAGSGTLEKLLKMGGKFGVDLGTSLTPGNTVGPLVGGYVNPAIPAAGTASRYGQKLLARGKAENLLKALEGRAPQVPAPLNVPNPPPAIGGGSAALAMPDAPMPQQTVTIVEPASLSTMVPQQENTYLQKLSMVESGNNPRAKSPTSSAYGKYQFTKDTWNAMVKKYGQQTGIREADIANPEAQDIMAELFTQDNAQSISKTLGREPNEGELYIAHFLGANGANKLFENYGSNQSAVKLFPQAALANKSIFYDGKRPRTVEELYDLLSRKVA